MLNKDNFIFNKNLGQNFLSSKIYLNKIDNILQIKDRDVVEVGPGSGCLTNIILKNQPKNLILIEKDKRLIEHLEKKYKNVSILNDDCLKLTINTDILISNLPYNISNEFLINLFFKNNVNEVYLMLQKELCEKLILGNSYLSIILKFIFNIEILFHVPPEAFTPKPKVYSSFIFMKKHNEIIIENKHKLFNLLKRLFENKNKKIINILNLKNNDNIPEYIKELRPMHCSMEDFILLSNLLK